MTTSEQRAWSPDNRSRNAEVLGTVRGDERLQLAPVGCPVVRVAAGFVLEPGGRGIKVRCTYGDSTGTTRSQSAEAAWVMPYLQLQVCPAFRQHAHNIQLSLSSGSHEGRGSVCSLVVHVRAALDKSLDGVHAAVLGRTSKWRVSGARLAVGIRPVMTPVEHDRQHEYLRRHLVLTAQDHAATVGATCEVRRQHREVGSTAPVEHTDEAARAWTRLRSWTAQTRCQQ